MANGPADKKKGNVNIKDLKKLIDLMRKAELTEVDIEQEGLKIKLRKGSEPQVAIASAGPAPAAPAPAPAAPAAPSHAPAAAPAASGPAPAAEAPRAGGMSITAPMVGTFYSAGSPDTPPFVKEGDRIEVGKTICIIEAMKLMNEIKAEVSGKVVKVLVENAQPVEYGQPLFIVEP